MAAGLVYGASFERRESVSLRGDKAVELVPIDGGSLSISWSSVATVEEVGKTLGIDPVEWPFYRDIETPLDVPLDEVRARCAQLRSKIVAGDTPAHDEYWLAFFFRILREGKDFFVFV